MVIVQRDYKEVGKQRRPLFKIALLIVAILSGCQKHEFAHRPFDSETWLEHREIRHEIVNDLIESRKLIGKNVVLVEERLGKPDLQEGEKMYYALDHTKYGAFDSAYLVVILDREGKVRRLDLFLN